MLNLDYSKCYKKGTELILIVKEDEDDRLDLLDNSLMDVDWIAKKMKVNQETVRRWIRSKKLKASISSKKHGYKIPIESLKMFLENNPRYIGLIEKTI